MLFTPDPKFEEEYGVEQSIGFFSQTLYMFIGEALAYPVFMYNNFQNGKLKMPSRTARQLLYPVIPAAFDFVACTLQNYSNTLILASIVNILYGSQVIFTSFATMVLIKRRIYPFEWTAVIITLVALVLIGVSSIHADETVDKSTSTKVLGFFMNLIGQCVASIQTVLLEYFMSDIDPIELVGLEGIYGILAYIFTIFPYVYLIDKEDGDPRLTNGATNRCLENVINSLICLRYWPLLLLVLSYVIFKAIYNIYIVLVINETCAINYSVLSNIVTLFVWIVLLIFGTNSKFDAWAEKWNNWSWLQLFGFILTVVATSLYNRVFELKFFEYPNITTKPNNSVSPEEEPDSKKTEDASV